jgi:hypothetical protein
MTSVFSGGLVYEYSQEGNNFGLVTINGGSVSENDDFNALQSALSSQSNPSGDGGYKANGSPSTCPPQSSSWDVSGDALPAIPEPAKAYVSSFFPSVQYTFHPQKNHMTLLTCISL